MAKSYVFLYLLILAMLEILNMLAGFKDPDIVGQAFWNIPGTYAWTVPEGVTEISAASIGGGGGGAGIEDYYSQRSGSAGGGGLGHTSSITKSILEMC